MPVRKLRICKICGFIGITAFFGKKDCNRCRKCDVKRSAKWRVNNPIKHKAQMLKGKYNLTLERYQELLDKQDNKCAVCHRQFDNTSKAYKPHVDHNHACCPSSYKSCGRCIRGLLCFNCNVFLGRIKDNFETAERMVNYLRTNEYTRTDAGKCCTTIGNEPRLELETNR